MSNRPIDFLPRPHAPLPHRTRPQEFRALVADIAEESVGDRDRFLDEAFSFLDANNDGRIQQAEFVRWWESSPQDDLVAAGADDGGLLAEQLHELRDKLGDKRGLFFGLTFGAWKRAMLLDAHEAGSWTAHEVGLFLRTNPAVAGCRATAAAATPSTALDPELFKFVDGARLLALTDEGLATLGVEEEAHRAELLGAIAQLAAASEAARHNRVTLALSSLQVGRRGVARREGGGGRAVCLCVCTCGVVLACVMVCTS